MKGIASVQIKATKCGWDKQQTTLMLTIIADKIPRVQHLLIVMVIAESKQKCVRINWEQQLRETELAKYIAGMMVK